MRKTKSKNWERLSRFSRSLPGVRAQLGTQVEQLEPHAFFPRQAAGEYLWHRKHVGLRSGKLRKRPKRWAGRSLREVPPRETTARLLPSSPSRITAYIQPKQIFEMKFNL
jgi:hypothetical protein